MNKAVLITGGAAGTGLAIAKRFAKEGSDVIITSRDAVRAEEAAKSLSYEFGIYSAGYGLDIDDEQRIADIFSDIDSSDRFIETVVLNAADLGYGSDPVKGLDFFTQTVEEFSRVLRTNLVWNFMIIRQAALRMREYGKGAVVFISSNTAYRAIPNRAAYGASKGGMLALSKALAVDLGQYGIRCNCVLPGTIKTERWYKMGDKQIVNGELTPIGDISDFDDIANAVWFLGSDESKNITGAEIIVDGGMSCQLYPQKLNEWKSKAAEADTKG
ncbi:MAG: SDR family oxidoreductase [Clostridiales bacterium]|nr:SDR family oxidoreductase [Clostridiales bacterium]